MNVIDISQGGALVMPVNLDMEDPNVSVFKVGSKLRNIELTFPSEEKVFRVHVDEAQVGRLGEHPVTNRTNFALQFTDIEKSQQKMLIDLIFTHQRNTLRKGLSKE
jgi:c-di-GMP-binding flagellar brake protein YcgR